MTTIALCSFPVKNDDPCRKKAVAYYIVGGEKYWRCAKHDTPRVRAKAEEMGAARQELAA